MQCSNKQEDHLTILKKLIDISFSWTCPAIDKEICHNIVQVVCGSTQLVPSGFTATLTINVMTKFMITSNTDEWKTDVNLLSFLPRFSRNSMNWRPQLGRCPFEAGAGNLSPGQGHSEDNQQKSHSLASVFLATLSRDPRNSEEAGSRLPGMKGTDYGFMYLSPIAIAREFYALLPQVV